MERNWVRKINRISDQRQTVSRQTRRGAKIKVLIKGIFKPHSPFKQFKSQLRKLKRIRINKNYCARAPSTSPWTGRRANDGKYIKIKGKWRRTLVKSKPWHEAKLSFSVFMDKWFVTLSNKEEIGVHKKREPADPFHLIFHFFGGAGRRGKKWLESYDTRIKSRFLPQLWLPSR